MLENHNITQKMRVKSKHFLFCILTIAFFFEFFNKKIEFLINFIDFLINLMFFGVFESF